MFLTASILSLTWQPMMKIENHNSYNSMKYIAWKLKYCNILTEEAVK